MEVEKPAASDPMRKMTIAMMNSGADRRCR
jgi:hypothetical protein